MAIVLLQNPASTPLAVDDYQEQNALLAAGFKQGTIPFTGSNMNEGTILQVGGAVYRVDATTAITGTASNYVKITPAGATASASFVANLSGVSWNTVYNGYYDGSGNRYLFDEYKALVAGVISILHTQYVVPDNSISTAKIVDSAITNVKISAVDGGKITTGTLPSGRLPALAGDVTSSAGSNSITWNAKPKTSGLGTYETVFVANNHLVPSGKWVYSLFFVYNGSGSSSGGIEPITSIGIPTGGPYQTIWNGGDTINLWVSGSWDGAIGVRWRYE